MYLTTKIIDYLGDNVKIPCADHDCDIIVDDTTVTNLITDPDIIMKYNRLIVTSFVQVSNEHHSHICSHWDDLEYLIFIQLKPNFRWCPSPGCNYAIRVDSSEHTCVTCQCGHRFCFKCDDDQDWHAPVLCEYLKKWKTSHAATANYIVAHTKPCPKCNVLIEKNGGCNHMVS